MAEDANNEEEAGEDRSLGVKSLWKAVENVAAAPVEDPLLGRTIGGVTIMRLLGEGGMGRVYEGLQESPRRPVALKVLRPGFFSREVLRRFLNESEILGQLRHPHISQVYSAGSFEIAGASLPFFVMELITKARSITDYVAAAQLSQREILALFQCVCDAVAHGHAQGFIHRDLKPGNILVDCHGHPKVIDFGVARASKDSSQGTALTDTGQLIGTLQYMSPEQIVAVTGGVDARADVYSLGVILFELLAGRPPYDVSRKTLVEAARIVQEQRPESLRKVNRAVPWHVAGIVETCLAKDRGARFADAGRLAEAIRDSVEGRAKEPSWLHVAIRSARGRVPEPLGRVTLGLLMATAATVAVWLTWTPRNPPGPPVTRDNQEVVPDPVDPRWNFSSQPVVYEADDRSFRYGFRDINQPGADRFLVESSGMKKWQDTFMFPRISYWAPAENGVQGTLVYRIAFPKPTTSVHLRAALECWDFTREPGGIGRGVAALEVSPDGEAWTSIIDTIGPRHWGEDGRIDEDLDAAFLGGRALWIRMRFLTEGAPVTNGYNVAQFGRTKPGDPENVFEVRATFRE